MTRLKTVRWKWAASSNAGLFKNDWRNPNRSARRRPVRSANGWSKRCRNSTSASCVDAPERLISSAMNVFALPVGRLFFPLDNALKLGAEGYAPALLKMIVSQGGRYAFSEAAKNLEELAGLEISAQHVMRLTERVGGAWVEARDRDVEAFKRGELARTYTEAPKAAAVMLDGGRLQTRESPSGPGVENPEWKEPKYACILTLDSKQSQVDPQPEPPAKFIDKERTPKLVREVQSAHGAALTREPVTDKAVSTDAVKKPVHKKKKKPRKHKRHLLRTVLGTMEAVDGFGFQVAAECHKRGLDLAKFKACVCDGQKSNWSVWETHLKEHGFIPVLDFLHLLTYIYAAACAVGGTSSEKWSRHVEWTTWAWQGHRDKMMTAVNGAVEKAGAIPDNAAENDPRRVLLKTQTYLANNLEKMDYPRYRKLGLPTSSAPVESVIKQFNRRVKGTEKFWRPFAVEAVLQIRAAYLSEDGRNDRLWNMPRCCRAARNAPLKPYRAKAS